MEMHPFPLSHTCKERKETLGSKSVHACGHPPTLSPLSHPTHMQELVKLLKERPGGPKVGGEQIAAPWVSVTPALNTHPLCLTIATEHISTSLMKTPCRPRARF